MASGHLKKRSKDGWTIIISHGYQLDPKDGKVKEKRTQKSFRHINKADARKIMIDMLDKLNKRKPVEQSPVTIEEYSARWLSWVKPQVSEVTYEGYEGRIKRYVNAFMADIKVADAEPEDFREFFTWMQAEKGLAPLTVRDTRMLLSSMFEQAIEDRIREWNPVKAAKLKNIKKPLPKPLEAGAVAKFLAQAVIMGRPREHDGKEWLCSYYEVYRSDLATGLRVSELAATEKGALNLEAEKDEQGNWLGTWPVVRAFTSVPVEEGKRELKVKEPKTDAGMREQPLDAATTAMLRGLVDRNPHKLVFCYTDGTRIHPAQISKHFAKIAKAAGLSGVTLHSLRHTYATELAELGVDPFVLQELMGHANIASTKVYTKVAKARKQDAVNKLGKVLRETDARQLRSKKDEEGRHIVQ